MAFQWAQYLVSAFYDEFVNQNNTELLDAFVATNVIVHDPHIGAVKGLAAFKFLLTLFRGGFPSQHTIVHYLCVEGDTISVAHSHCEPKEQVLTFGGYDVFRLAGGKIVECWRSDDDARLMRPLKATSGPQRASD
jgi:predicted SnoaL-like aldol condensation-catalyzing enzyme